MPQARILVTGSRGLIGAALRSALHVEGYLTAGLDLLGHGLECGDVRSEDDVRRAMHGCNGVIHLAAVSRVAWAERDPAHCRSVNVDGTATILAGAKRQANTPWVLFVSSREVYGKAGGFPVSETAPFRPVNAYGRSKVDGERMADHATRSGQRVAVARLSNVYGSVSDHRDRVVPAFARIAARGGEMRVEGSNCYFDFTHLTDAVSGLVAMAMKLDSKGSSPLPPIQFVTGHATSLGELARLAQEFGAWGTRIVELPRRTFDVSEFCGDPSRALTLLGWAAQVRLAEGLRKLVGEFSQLPAQAPP